MIHVVKFHISNNEVLRSLHIFVAFYCFYSIAHHIFINIKNWIAIPRGNQSLKIQRGNYVVPNEWRQIQDHNTKKANRKITIIVMIDPYNQGGRGWVAQWARSLDLTAHHNWFKSNLSGMVVVTLLAFMWSHWQQLFISDSQHTAWLSVRSHAFTCLCQLSTNVQRWPQLFIFLGMLK